VSQNGFFMVMSELMSLNRCVLSQTCCVETIVAGLGSCKNARACSRTRACVRKQYLVKRCDMVIYIL
jgi:hypothetical protein